MTRTLDLEALKRQLQAVATTGRSIEFRSEHATAILAALERIPELERENAELRAIHGSKVEMSREIIRLRKRAGRLEAAAREALALCKRSLPMGAADVLEAALADAPQLRGIGTNEDGDAIAVYEDGSRVNLEDPGLAAPEGSHPRPFIPVSRELDPDRAQAGWSLAEQASRAAAAPCPKCEGCGWVADTDDQEPWTFWMKLPLESAAAVVIGLVKPIPCPVCSAPAPEGSDV